MTRGGGQAEPDRRRFLRRAGWNLLAGLLLAGLGAGGYGFLIEPARLRLERVRIPLPGLPPALEGLTIGQLTDLHVGPYVPREHIRRAVQLLMSRRPDLIVLTGDYICRFSRGIPGGLLSDLRAPHGVFAVLGNHDYWHGAGPVVSALEADGVRVLVNERVRIDPGGAPLWIVGLDDWWEGRPDLESAMSGLSPGDHRVLLVHEPDFADQIGPHRVDLQISGHSHGGQVRIPLLGAPILPRMGRIYPEGLARAGDTLVYTSRGVGMIPPPVRLNCPPEVTLLELSR